MVTTASSRAKLADGPVRKRPTERRGFIFAAWVMGWGRATISTRSELSHSITSSASARSDGGTSRPSALAVLILMTKSNLVD